MWPAPGVALTRRIDGGILVQDLLHEATTRAIRLPLDVFEFLLLL
jgi:hypothetical protein